MAGSPLNPSPARVLFVTGKLAEPALRRVLADMAPAFAYDMAVLKITVAALMTTDWIARFLTVPAGVDLVLPGTFAPSYSNTFVLVNNDGSDSITGTFNGLVVERQ